MAVAFVPAHPQLKELWDERIDEPRLRRSHASRNWMGSTMFILGCLVSSYGVGSAAAILMR